MILRSRKTAILIASLAALLSTATVAVRAESSERDKQTSGVTPDKTGTSAGEAKREGTGEGRETPADKTPTDKSR